MVDIIRLKIMQGKYAELEEVCKKMNISQVRDIIRDIAYETESISVYSFITYMINRTKKIEWVELAVDIMINPLCFIEGAYSVALFHTRELMKYEKNIENMEKMLFFYNIPESLIDKKEAFSIAKEILDLDPNNEVALEVKNIY